MFEKAIEIILIIVSYIPEYCLKIPCPRRLIDGIYDLFKTIGDYFIYGPLFGGKVGKLFRNVAYYDQYYFNSLFEHFVFPDGNAPHWESLSWLQKRFMKWFNKERTKAVLTFPVETMALLTKDGDVLGIQIC